MSTGDNKTIIQILRRLQYQKDIVGECLRGRGKAK